MRVDLAAKWIDLSGAVWRRGLFNLVDRNFPGDSQSHGCVERQFLSCTRYFVLVGESDVIEFRYLHLEL